MAVYRNFYTKFWNDSIVQKMAKDEKYLFSYLFTNEHTTLCGIYEITPETIHNETSIKTESVLEILNSLQEKGRIVYNLATNEICVRSWLKYNATKSPQFQTALNRSFNEVKEKGLIRYLYGIDTVSIGSNSVNDLSTFEDLSIKDLSTLVPLSPKKKEVKQREDKIFKEYCGENEVLYRALMDFLDMRDKIRKPMTDRAKKMLCNDLDQLALKGQNVVECVKQSVKLAWQGVFEVKGNYQRNSAGTSATEEIERRANKIL